MWIFLNDSFLSIIAHPTRKHLMTVRARLEEDILNVFPDARVHATPGRDYQFRATVTRKGVARSLAREVGRIDYTNFKDSVPERRRHDIYLRVWTAMTSLARRAWDEPQEYPYAFHAESLRETKARREAEEGRLPEADPTTEADDPGPLHRVP